MLRIGVALCAALALGACGSASIGLAPAPSQAAAASPGAQDAAPQPLGEWKYDGRIEQTTGKPVGRAYLRTDKVTLRVGKLLSDPAFLLLDCFKNEPTIMFRFTGGRVGFNNSSSLTYRFDDKPPREPRVRFLRGARSIVIEDRASVRQFVAELRNATTLLVSVKSMTFGMTRAEFPVQHAAAAIEKSFAACPLPDEKAPRMAARESRR